MKPLIAIIRISAIVGITIFLLSGCAVFGTHPQTTHATSWKKRTAQLSQMQSWTATGSISVQHEGKADLASLRWEQEPNQYQFMLFGPLGFGKVMIQGAPGSITLTKSGKSPITATTPENLMQSQLGWYVPIANFYYWSRGLPAPQIAARTTFDAQHRLISLKQEDWQINYLAYMPVGSLELPTKMEFSTAQLKIKWVIKDWIVNTENF